MSFWEIHKQTIYMYGEIYATFCGLVVINYNLQQSTNTLGRRLAVGYSHIVSALLVVVAPLYFVLHLPALLEAPDPRMRLLLIVSVVNMAIKYVTVVVTYVANLIHYAAVREFSRTRQQLEDELVHNLQQEDEQPRRLFERRLILKFGLVNLMMLVQVGNIVSLWWTQNANPVCVQAAIYTFFLWNYTENMANYFYFISSSALRFYQQLDQRLQHLVHRAELIEGSRQVLLSNELSLLAALYTRIHRLYTDSVAGHQLQILGLVLTTLISNLTNSFTLFNLFLQHSWVAETPAIVLNTMHALIYYVDTYLVSLVSENIDQELVNIGLTMRSFGQIAELDTRLLTTIEQFSLRLLPTRSSTLICGLFNLDRRLIFLTAASVLTYFITLVQFYLNLTRT